MRRRSFLLASLAGLLVGVGAAADPGPISKEQTLANLKTAHAGALGSRDWFIAAAKQADVDGFAKLGVLFRAASQCEATHAANFAKVIDKLGGTPGDPVASTLPLKSSAENVAAVLPDLALRAGVLGNWSQDARAAQQVDAIKPFNYSKQNLTRLTELLRPAQSALEAWKATAIYYVCNICGHVVDKIDFKKCVVCFFSKDEYKPVN